MGDGPAGMAGVLAAFVAGPRIRVGPCKTRPAIRESTNMVAGYRVIAASTPEEFEKKLNEFTGDWSIVSTHMVCDGGTCRYCAIVMKKVPQKAQVF
jgi:hypothetical protein